MVTEKAQAEAELRQYMPSVHCLFKQRSINKKRKKITDTYCPQK